MDLVPISDATPRSVGALAPSEGPTLVVADWLSDRARALLRARGVSFIDATGNAEVGLSEPGLFVRTEGARRNPSPKQTKGPSLRGAKAWALLRTLAEVPPPLGVRELAEAVDVDAGYVSRVLSVLEQELLVTRAPRGPVTEVEWQGVLRRVASTYSFVDSNKTSTWVASAGPERLLADLAGKRAGKWAITGSFAASRLAPVAAPEVAVIYAEDPDRLARTGRLLPAARGANVVVAEPYDPIVFERTVNSGGDTYASTAQVALDCLTGNGRMPAEGEAVLAWMRKNERRWRSASIDPRRKTRIE
ncbi:MAG TPA: helix-turn-helix domain-containing protein [Acidimicrobiales bacterium]|nr:helix-turn-helix domain-containing protein [Acidimicrobiales bacterium]